MPLKTIQIIFLGLIIATIVLNGFIQYPRLIQAIDHLKTNQVQRVGQEFKGLRPYLQDVAWAGYVSCLKAAHPATEVAIMAPYQQAQFILSPVLLDFDKADQHRYVILQCPDQAKAKAVQGHLNARVVARSAKDIWLLDRGKE